MAGKTITELVELPEVTAELQIPIDDGVQTYKATATQIRDFSRTAQVAAIDDTDSPYTITTQDVILADATDDPITVNLPTAVGASGRVIRVKKVDDSANAVTVTDGVLSVAMNQGGDSVTVISDGTSWLILDKAHAGVPTGAVLAHASDVAPSGFLVCDGSTVSRTTYADLFTAIGTVHGSGDGSTTFHLPDYRGRFLRGHANGSTNDPDRASRTAMNTGGATGDSVGSVQADAFQGHAHNFDRQSSDASSGGGSRLTNVTGTNHTNAVTSPRNLSGYGTARFTSETRPKNANVTYIIKY